MKGGHWLCCNEVAALGVRFVGNGIAPACRCEVGKCWCVFLPNLLCAFLSMQTETPAFPDDTNTGQMQSDGGTSTPHGSKADDKGFMPPTGKFSTPALVATVWQLSQPRRLTDRPTSYTRLANLTLHSHEGCPWRLESHSSVAKLCQSLVVIRRVEQLLESVVTLAQPFRSRMNSLLAARRQFSSARVGWRTILFVCLCLCMGFHAAHMLTQMLASSQLSSSIKLHSLSAVIWTVMWSIEHCPAYRFSFFSICVKS